MEGYFLHKVFQANMVLVTGYSRKGKHGTLNREQVLIRSLSSSLKSHIRNYLYDWHIISKWCHFTMQKTQIIKGGSPYLTSINFLTSLLFYKNY